MCADVLCKQLEYTIVHWLSGVTPYEWRSQALADLAVVFLWGERGWLGEETQARYPKAENSADLGHYFLGGAKIHFRKNEEMSDLPPAREVPKIIENMTEVDIFDVEEKCAFLCISVGFESIMDA